MPKWILCQRECARITCQHGDPLSCSVGLLRGGCIMKNWPVWQGSEHWQEDRERLVKTRAEAVMSPAQDQTCVESPDGKLKGGGLTVGGRCWDCEALVCLLSKVLSAKHIIWVAHSQSVSCSLPYLLITSSGCPLLQLYSTLFLSYYSTVITSLLIYLVHRVLDNTITFLMVEFFSADSE